MIELRRGWGWLIFACAAWLGPACDDGPPEKAFSTSPLERAARPAPYELTNAVENGSLPAVRSLLARGADPNAKDPQGRTALHAFFSGRNWKLAADLLDLLLSAGADPAATDPQGATALHLAARRGRREFVERLCREKADPNLADRQGRTPLHEAASHERPGVVAALTACGANIDRPDRQGRTPLHLAAEARDWNTAFTLLSGGADPQAEDDWGQRPIGWLAATCSDQIQERLRLPGRPEETVCNHHPALAAASLHVAAAQGRLAVVRELLSRGAAPADRMIVGSSLGSPGSALHAAAAAGRVEVVRALLGAGMPPDPLDANGWTPLHLAAWKGRRGVMAALLEAGADPDRPTRSGQTPAKLAKQAGHSESGALLKKARRTAR